MTKKNLVPHTPHGNKKLELLVVIFGIFGHSGLFIQAAKIFMLKSSYAISLTTFLISLISSSVWFIYGIRCQNKPLIISNIVGIIGICLVITATVIYS